MKHAVDLYLQEQELIKKYKEINPDGLTPSRNFSYQEILKRVGIDVDFGYLPQGYLSFYHQDFIVEEIQSNGQISTIEPADLEITPIQEADNKTLYADLVKVGLSTLEAREGLAKALAAEPENIGYFGIKDKVAITSQRISLRQVKSDQIKDLKVPGLFLKNLFWSKGVAQKGKILGNQFTIVVRTPTTLGQGWLDQALDRVKDGFYNFYYLQRFGSPRLLSHELGRLILQQDYQGVIKTFFTNSGVQDVPRLNQLRQEVLQNFGDWEKVENTFLKLPYTFRLELEIVSHLKKQPDDYLGALKLITDQTTLWVYAYASYLFNSYLSELIKAGKSLPTDLPLLLNPKALTVDFYLEKLRADKIVNLKAALIKIFGHSAINEKNICLVKSPVKIVKTKIIENGVAIAFQLPAAVYATTFLTHLFSLYRGLPLPEWLDKTKHDSKQILGLGSVAATEAVLGEYIFSPHEAEE